MSGQNLLPAQRLTLPLLPLRDVVVFPHMVIPLFVGRPRSIRALEAAMEGGKNIMLAAQKSASKDDPKPEDVYEIGCLATILQMLKLPDGTVKVLVEGTQRARVLSIEDVESHFLSDVMPVLPDEVSGSEVEALRRAIVGQFETYVKLNKKIPPEILTSLAGIDNASRLADTIAAHLPLKLEQKQQMLEVMDTAQRLESLLTQLETEIDILQVEKRIRGRVKKQMEKTKGHTVICTTIWKEGINIPSLDSIVLGGGWKSPTPILQAIGRGLRTFESKKEVVIHDFFDPSHNYLISHFGERLSLYFEMNWM
jgi:ATP-dependent Lon protease